MFRLLLGFAKGSDGMKGSLKTNHTVFRLPQYSALAARRHFCSHPARLV
ncbi:hypothetical protein GCWU000324_02174 [Kingella oralis ATCC 51147]|uniref:Uncharacterized protein n=1 Tax=Kingella oralis ATCC 51147 TaxID=629741 RepID=C4GJF1_9NEIS|nr:hypothetical protein GCWU000324_02174 [Kingella oralis ATCC 51147]